LAASKTHDQIAAQFGISRRNVGAILDGRSRSEEFGTDKRRRVYEALTAAGRPLHLRDIVPAAGLTNDASAVALLRKLIRDGHAERIDRGTYRAVQAVR
jgi:hypothetical protein